MDNPITEERVAGGDIKNDIRVGFLSRGPDEVVTTGKDGCKGRRELIYPDIFF